MARKYSPIVSENSNRAVIADAQAVGGFASGRFPYRNCPRLRGFGHAMAMDGDTLVIGALDPVDNLACAEIENIAVAGGREDGLLCEWFVHGRLNVILWFLAIGCRPDSNALTFLILGDTGKTPAARDVLPRLTNFFGEPIIPISRPSRILSIRPDRLSVRQNASDVLDRGASTIGGAQRANGKLA
jgi:hypothetical protein